MFKILGTIPKKVNIALSGGVDSMVMLDFICKGRNPGDVTALYFNHNAKYFSVISAKEKTSNLKWGD